MALDSGAASSGVRSGSGEHDGKTATTSSTPEVEDVVAFNPYTLVVLRIRKLEVTRYISPVETALERGRTCTA